MNDKIIFLDLETTSLDAAKADVIELAYNVHGSMINELYMPTRHALQCGKNNIIPFEVQSITNISDEDVQGRSHFIHSIEYTALKQLANEGYTLVSHNVDYDGGILEAQGINFKSRICTLKIAWWELGGLPNHQLGTLRAYFGIQPTGIAHRATYDVEILMAVFEKLQKLNSLADMYTRYEEATIKFDFDKYNVWKFGKLKGQPIDKNNSDHYGLARWYLNQPEDPRYPRDPKFVNNLKRLFNL